MTAPQVGYEARLRIDGLKAPRARQGLLELREAMTRWKINLTLTKVTRGGAASVLLGQLG